MKNILHVRLVTVSGQMSMLTGQVKVTTMNLFGFELMGNDAKVPAIGIFTN